MGNTKNDLRVTPPPRSARKGDRVTDTDVAELQRSIEKIASAVNKSAKHTEQIPEIKAKVDSTSDKVIQLDTKMSVTTERITKIEDKVDRGHDCYQVDVIAEVKDAQREASQKIETDIQKGIEQRGKLDSVIKDQSQTEADVQDIRKAPRRMFYGLMGILVTVIVGAGGAVWFLAELSKDVEFERTQRVQQNKQLVESIKAVGTKADTAPVQRALENLEEELEESNGHELEFNQLCEGMPRHEKRTVKSVLQRRNKRVPTSCM